MHAERFDALTRAVDARTRRRFLAAVPAFGMGWLAFTNDDAAAKCKKKCGPCKQCKKGKCKKQRPDGTACAGGTCQSGRCVAAPPVCPPVCPVCQGCNATSGLCEAHPSQQGLPAPGCAAPRVCCGGSCCDPIHACNTAGTCARCDEVCAAGCMHCLTLADGGTACGGAHSCILGETCSSTADCPAGKVCATSFTSRISNATFQSCGEPIGSGVCWTITPCS